MEVGSGSGGSGGGGGWGGAGGGGVVQREGEKQCKKTLVGQDRRENRSVIPLPSPLCLAQYSHAITYHCFFSEGVGGERAGWVCVCVCVCVWGGGGVMKQRDGEGGRELQECVCRKRRERGWEE